MRNGRGMTLGDRARDRCAGALWLVLHYLGSSMLEISLQQIFALMPSTVSHYIKFAMTILLKTLQAMLEAKICFPKTSEELTKYTNLICTCHPLLRGAFASIDSLSLVMQVLEDPEIKNMTYNSWKSDHCILNIPSIFSLLGMIIAAVLNPPGSWHNSHSATHVYKKLKGIPSGFFLVADSVFPRGTKDIAGKIKTPVKDGD
ncbi:hypothetical protein BDN71DRAFT_1561504 [Pleurotus eryngii]|uniref:DDE Tnp4 domain-containing protein n=1 Tax=Pleurotus eryngii TaxID=5323 RepID=A0A9P6DG84_PLEER|nr:hypothetical protein BDN71DRAFT_1561504 [Pleurotus eryngii]